MGPCGLVPAFNHIFHFFCKVIKPRGGGAPTYGLYRYVPRNRVWFFRFSVLK